MPNIPALPSGLDLAKAEQLRGDYGDHATWSRDGSIASLVYGGSIVASVSVDGYFSVDLPNLDSTVVPYVNAFLDGTSQRVERYWRTKAYRLIGGTKASAPAVVRPTIQQRVEQVETLVTVPEQGGGVPVERVVLHDESAIPGVEVPEAVKTTRVKGQKGWVRVGDIVVPETDVQTLRDAWTIRQSGVPASVLITGPAGTAKTALVRAFAASMGVPFLKVDGGAIRTADDWAGAFRQDPNTKTWQHRWSPFARVLQRGEPCIVLIDEINRPESPQALNALLGLLDWTGSLLVPDANAVLTMPPGVLVIATANIGPEFVGTLPLDGAVRQRFPYGIRLDYPIEAVEVDLVSTMTGVAPESAERLVTLASLQRMNREDAQQYPSGAVISTRVVLDIARRIAVSGTPDRDAVISTLRAQFDPGDEAALSILIDTQYPIEVEIENDAPIEIDEDEAHRLARKAAGVAEDDSYGARYANWECPADKPENAHPVRVSETRCLTHGTLNPAVAGLAAAAAAARPAMITVAKHYFVNRGMDGALRTECQYRHDPAKPDVCGRSKAHSIHHNS